MRRLRTHAGFTLIEVMIVVAILGALSVLGVMLLQGAFGDARAKTGARSLADLLQLAREEAIRTGDNHLVFFGQDAQDNDLTTGGMAAAAILVRDADADGEVDTGETVAGVHVDATGTLSWGSVFAAAGSDKAPNDNPAATFPETDPDFLCCTFLDPGDDPARWVAFLPDGIPRAFSITPFATGDVGTGSGAVYVTSGARDYAIVLAPLGGVRVHTWDRGAEAWTR
jgi:prepilin-type N-terminal cleavage/methylation domain-containing protein